MAESSSKSSLGHLAFLGENECCSEALSKNRWHSCLPLVLQVLVSQLPQFPLLWLHFSPPPPSLSCLLLLQLAAFKLNPLSALQSSPKIPLASLPSGHYHPPYLKLLSLTHTPGFMPPARQDLTHNLRERDLCHPCSRSDFTRQGYAEE